MVDEFLAFVAPWALLGCLVCVVWLGHLLFVPRR
jgi:hypothetical protein